MSVKWDKTRSVEGQIEDYGLQDIVDAYDNAILLQQNYFEEKALLDTLPVASSVWYGAVKQVVQTRRAYAGALVLAAVMVEEYDPNQEPAKKGVVRRETPDPNDVP